MIKRALLSTFEKEGLAEFARGLEELGVELVASGGTADYLEEHGIETARVEDLTEIPELLGGRVKTLHPRIHAAILARRDHPDDLAALDQHGIRPFDLVCVNLYPFTQVISRRGVQEEDAVEMIDIGGPSMLRAAAKNFAHVAPVCKPERYGPILAELRQSRGLSGETRRILASEAFATTAAYEAAIARWFSDIDAFPETYTPSFVKVTTSSTGRTPTSARRTTPRRARGGTCSPRRAAAWARALVQQPRRPVRGALALDGVHGALLRDRQAREPCRRRRRGLDRGGLRTRAGG